MKITQESHKVGIARLDAIFGWNFEAHKPRAKHSRPKSKRLRRKRAHEARRKNR